MKGLLVKDLHLLMGQKTNALFMVAICLVLMFTQNSVIFGVCYMTVLAGTLAIGTVNYDAFENGMTFIMTLPIQRKAYVLEKYLFVFLAGLISSVVMGGIGLIFVEGSLQKEAIANVLGATLVALVIVAVMVSIMLPVQLKFGVEKARLVIVLIAGLVFAVVTFFYKFIEKLEVPSIQLATNQLLLLFGVAIIAIVASSMLISVKIVERKEY